MRNFAMVIGLWLAGASPASAQIWDGGRSAVPDTPMPADPGVTPMLNDLRRDLRTARRSGQITRQEERSLRRQAAVIAAAQRRYRSAGLSSGERQELMARTEALKGAIDAQRTP
ncbi:hypothetical protein ACNI3Q_05170 [Sphingomonas sp. FW199]|uniref:hypothetical protein n=1 Tax=Sphingomonas sp. FW199 TaxID=3400217 RepID=UPI003CEF4D16